MVTDLTGDALVGCAAELTVVVGRRVRPARLFLQARAVSDPFIFEAEAQEWTTGLQQGLDGGCRQAVIIELDFIEQPLEIGCRYTIDQRAPHGQISGRIELGGGRKGRLHGAVDQQLPRARCIDGDQEHEPLAGGKGRRAGDRAGHRINKFKTRRSGLIADLLPAVAIRTGQRQQGQWRTGRRRIEIDPAAQAVTIAQVGVERGHL